jgi:NTE family protein
MYTVPLTGLVLSGGGARAAYQVGVLNAIARMRREYLSGEQLNANPFGIICGTSAGAINAAALACHADHFDAAIRQLVRVWSNFKAEQVYSADAIETLGIGDGIGVLSMGWLLAKWRVSRPRSMLDNTPLYELMQRWLLLGRLPRLLTRRHLQALAITASSYGSGEHFTFYQAASPVPPWSRWQRLSVPAQITHQHLLASSAIPFIFPAAELEHASQRGWFGDGSMRQTAPLSPAIHLGAQRLLVIGAGRMQEPAGGADGGSDLRNTGYPSMAQIAGHALSSIFLDALSSDIERMQRVNRTISLMPESARLGTPLRRLDALVIAPSQHIGDIAAKHIQALPQAVRSLLLGMGGSATDNVGATRGSALASYLLFESAFTQELLALGEADTDARRDEVLEFFRWDRIARPRSGHPVAS